MKEKLKNWLVFRINEVKEIAILSLIVVVFALMPAPTWGDIIQAIKEGTMASFYYVMFSVLKVISGILLPVLIAYLLVRSVNEKNEEKLAQTIIDGVKEIIQESNKELVNEIKESIQESNRELVNEIKESIQESNRELVDEIKKNNQEFMNFMKENFSNQSR